MNPDYEKEMLSKLVSPPTLVAYEDTSWFKRLTDRAEGARQAKAATATAGAAHAKMQASVEPDLKAARDAHIETSVLGIELGQPVDLPPCPTTNDEGLASFIGGLLVDTSPLPGPCRVVSGGAMGLASLFNKVAITGEFAPLPGTEDVAVRLPASKCPDWVSCSIIVTVKDDYAIMVSLLTRGNDSFADIERKLAVKYHKGADKGALTRDAR